jgi:putative hydrolase of the HAD superfamily
VDLELPDHSIVVFDLDDTLYKEIDYVISAYRAISLSLENVLHKDISGELLGWYLQGHDAFALAKSMYDLSISVEQMIEIYRFHSPSVSLAPGALALLTQLKTAKLPLGLLTDGRSKSQRAKINALGIVDFFDAIVISEEFGSSKPDARNYQYFERQFPERLYIYVGDNYSKDFVTPNLRRWTTIGVQDDGRNIHKMPPNLPSSYLPTCSVKSLMDINLSFLR